MGAWHRIVYDAVGAHPVAASWVRALDENRVCDLDWVLGLHEARMEHVELKPTRAALWQPGDGKDVRRR